jgi:uncharacterized cupredoxin-like copper-binding protein
MSIGERNSARASRWLVIPALLAFGVVAGCAAPVAKGGAGDGGVVVTQPPASSAGAEVDIVVSDTKGLGGPMIVKTFQSTVKAGNVTFKVANVGTIEHELIVLQTNTPYDQLPVVDSGDPPAPVKTGADKVDEATNIGETGDPNLKPGDTRTFIIKNMKPGKYALVCNIALHYGLGMRAPLTVLP